MCLVKQLELLSPAKNCEQGIAAISHGADAVYIGAPSFGARAAAGNRVEEIEELSRYAHLYGAKVFVTVNTLLFDEELEEASVMIRALYNIGVDALIIQDPGLLELDLPPIELHASTQMHNLDPRRVKFLEQVGFRRIILPRELSLQQMAEIRSSCDADLEAFVQGALCVCYSGQCYLSQYLNEHSGNRGNCSQPCRSSYDLYNEQGRMLQHKRHLLSLKDFSAAQYIENMIDCGITSFKIEGRLKDIGYVKNTTAYYRQLLDNLMERHAKAIDDECLSENVGKTDKAKEREEWHAASCGKCRFFFVPDPERTFNRGFTDYFLVHRQPMASLSTQKSLGKMIGTVSCVRRDSITLQTNEVLTPGDGLCFFNKEGELEGLQVNHVQGNTFIPNHLTNVEVGTAIWRNSDFAFEKQLQGKSAERKMAVDMTLSETQDGVTLHIVDEEGITAEAHIICDKEEAHNPEKTQEQWQRQLQKLGDTAFVLRELELPSHPSFLPASQLNELRRLAIANLTEKRLSTHRPAACLRVKNDIPYFEKHLNYLGNVVNNKAEEFYKHHGTSILEYGLEKTKDYDNKALMTSKYCLRFELGQCLCLKNNTVVAPQYQGNLLLRNNKRLFRLSFDCKRCEMSIYACKETVDSLLQKTDSRED